MAGNKNNHKTNFGILLQQYREDHGLSQLALERVLWKNEYPITNGLVSRYESGKRHPSPGFIRTVAKVLNLKAEEIIALVEAHFADLKLEFWNHYNADSK